MILVTAVMMDDFTLQQPKKNMDVLAARLNVYKIDGDTCWCSMDNKFV